MVLSEGSCTGKLRAACPTKGAVDGLKADSRAEMRSATETQKEQALNLLQKFLFYTKTPKGEKSSDHNRFDFAVNWKYIINFIINLTIFKTDLNLKSTTHISSE